MTLSVSKVTDRAGYLAWQWQFEKACGWAELSEILSSNIALHDLNLLII